MNANRRSSNMKTFVLVSLAIVGTFAACYLVFGQASDSQATDINPTALYDLYTHWKRANNYTYGGAEDKKRFAVFSDHYQTILNHNNDESNTYKLGLNKFAALSREEFASLYLGYRADMKPEVGARRIKVLKDTAIPASVDWTTQGAVTPVKNQGQCGSCWAFSTTGSLEGLNFLKNGKLESFSEQELVDCSNSFGNQGCNGGLMDQGFQYVESKGIVSEQSYPYKAVDERCKVPAGAAFKVKGFTDVAPNDPNALKTALAQQPVSVAIEADQDVFQLYKSGVITGTKCGTQLDHGVLAVGYGTLAGKDFFKVKNSWGADWGQQGYVLIGVAPDAGVCGINSQPSYPTI